MVPAIEAEPVPLSADSHGVLRIGRSRVTLAVVVDAFQVGATPEEIAQQYPTLKLADVYGVISYYLRHQQEVEDYLAHRRDETARIRRDNEARFDPASIRDRLVARRGQ